MEKIQIPKLKGKSSFTVWKLQVESTLQYHDFEGILTGERIGTTRDRSVTAAAEGA